MVKLRFRLGSSYRENVSTLHVALEKLNGSDLHVNEHQKIRHHRGRSTGEEEEDEEGRKMVIFTSRGAHLDCTIMAMLYTHSIGNQP